MCKKLNIFVFTILFLGIVLTVYSNKPTSAATPTVVSLTTSTVTQPKRLKVAVLFADARGDLGWNFAHFRGWQEVKKQGKILDEKDNSFTIQLENGVIIEVVLVENCGYSDTDIERRMESVIQEGYTMVFGTWWDSQGAISRLGQKYPDVKFEHCSGYPFLKPNGTNISTYFIRQEQGDFVAGYIVGLMGYSRVGMVGTHQIPEPVRAAAGFKWGMDKGNEEAGKNPSNTELNVIWIKTWLDQTLETQAAQALMDAGYPVIRQLADTPYSSQTACSKTGTLAVGYGSDVSKVAPCSVVTNEWNWGPYYVRRVLAAANGTWKSENWWGGFESDAIKMVGWGSFVPPEVRAKAEKMVQDIREGKFNPFCGPLEGIGLDKDGTNKVKIIVPAGVCLSDDQLLSMQWLAAGTKGEFPPYPPDGHPFVVATTTEVGKKIPLLVWVAVFGGLIIIAAITDIVVRNKKKPSM